MKNIKFIEKNRSNIHKIKNTMNIIREPRKRQSHQWPYIVELEAKKYYKSCKGQ